MSESATLELPETVEQAQVEQVEKPKPKRGRPAKAAVQPKPEPKSTSPVPADHYAEEIPVDGVAMLKRVQGFIGMLQLSPDARILDLSFGNQPRQEASLTRYRVQDQQIVRIEFVIPR